MIGYSIKIICLDGEGQTEVFAAIWSMSSRNIPVPRVGETIVVSDKSNNKPDVSMSVVSVVHNYIICGAKSGQENLDITPAVLYRVVVYCHKAV